MLYVIVSPLTQLSQGASIHDFTQFLGHELSITELFLVDLFPHFGVFGYLGLQFSYLGYKRVKLFLEIGYLLDFLVVELGIIVHITLQGFLAKGVIIVHEILQFLHTGLDQWGLFIELR